MSPLVLQGGYLSPVLFAMFSLNELYLERSTTLNTATFHDGGPSTEDFKLLQDDLNSDIHWDLHGT